MKKILILIFATAILGGLCAKGQLPAGGEVVSADLLVPLGELSALQTEGSWEVTLVKGAEPSLRIEATATDRGWYTYHRGVLRLGTKSRLNISLNSQKFRATVTIPDFPEEITSSASSSILVDFPVSQHTLAVKTGSSSQIRFGDLELDSLRVEGSSSGTLFLDRLLARELEVELSSSSEVEIGEGEVDRLEAQCSSSSELLARGLKVNRFLSVMGSSSSEMSLGLSGSAQVEGELSSSSDLTLYGTIPASLLNNIKASSSASLNVVND
ncbi:MAG: DUF2807 domain-containing protein [Spirochaetales bacterium]|nr:DUF2807 domain-containing protein [Spirochaetales bacterium]